MRTGTAATADLVLLGGRVLTGSWPAAAARAVAVRGGRVAAVGGIDAVRGMIGRRTETIDVRGGLVLPGFQDAHVHPVLAGLQLGRCDLSAAASRQECLRMVAAYAARHPGPGWIVGGGWSSALFPRGLPDRRDLDLVAPGRPVYLLDGDQHNGWVNSAALARAGIDATTPDPPGGRIARDPDGEPGGCLHENACDLVGRHLPPPTREQLLRALRVGRDVLRGCGVTAWQDALVGPYLGCPDPFDTYLTAAGRGLVDWRAAGALWWDRDRGPEQLAELTERRARAAAVGLRFRHVKIMQDGICENRTASLGAPYLDAPAGCPHPSGTSLLPADVLADTVTALERHGFSAHFHAVGDRAVRECLDAVAAARARNGPRAVRHHIAHVQVVHPADVQRFGPLGVTATIQPLWAAAVPQMTDLIMPGLGPRRAGWQYPFAGLRRAGARLAAGSDWPVSSPSPVFGIHVAVNRRPAVRSACWLDSRRDWPRFLPAESLPARAAVAAYTRGSAFVNGVEDRTGSIEVGRVADLVVLDRDLFGCAPDDIESCEVSVTVVGGAVVHDAAERASWRHAEPA